MKFLQNGITNLTLVHKCKLKMSKFDYSLKYKFKDGKCKLEKENS